MPAGKDMPSAYTEGYDKARAVNREVTDTYIRHTRIGDPALDPVFEEISCLHPADLHRFIGAGIEQRDDELRAAPEPLRHFFRDLQEPAWLDYDAFQPGIRAFHANADLMLAAFVAGVLVEGFSTLIAKSFNKTGRVAATTRRLRQNNRQLVEIFFPEGLRRDGEGWKLSVRVRFVHARLRSLLGKLDDWDRDIWGEPLSAAHLGFAISVFSKRLLDYSRLLGASFNEQEYESVLSVWRYTGHLMGIPETILYTDGAEAEDIYNIALMCEPAPNEDSIVVANALIGAIPKVIDISDEAQKEKILGLAYRISRALIGNDLADQFQYPKNFTFGTLFLFRMQQRVQRLLKGTNMVRRSNFNQLLNISVYEEAGLSYDLPDHVKHEKSRSW